MGEIEADFRQDIENYLKDQQFDSQLNDILQSEDESEEAEIEYVEIDFCSPDGLEKERELINDLVKRTDDVK